MTRLLLHQRALCEGQKCPPPPHPMPHAQHVLRRTHTPMFTLRYHLTIWLCRCWVVCPTPLQTRQSISVNVLPEWTFRRAECRALLFVPDRKLDVQTENSALHTQYNTIGRLGASVDHLYLLSYAFRPLSAFLRFYCPPPFFLLPTIQ